MRNVERVLIAMLGLGFGTAFAARPDFSGEWKLNTSKSEFGPAPAPSNRTDKIIQKDASIKIIRTQAIAGGQGTTELTCTTDGKPCDVAVSGSAIKFSGAFQWVDDVLTFDAKGAYNGGDLKIHEKWALSADGRTITIQRHLTVAEGEVDQTLVMEKQ
jgi:hypothetical protein